MCLNLGGKCGVIFPDFCCRMKMRRHQNRLTWRKFSRPQMENKYSPSLIVSFHCPNKLDFKFLVTKLVALVYLLSILKANIFSKLIIQFVNVAIINITSICFTCNLTFSSFYSATCQELLALKATILTQYIVLCIYVFYMLTTNFELEKKYISRQIDEFSAGKPSENISTS